LSQHQLAIAYEGNGQVKEAIELLERVVTIKAEVLTEDDPSRLASQHVLATAYQANGQVKEAVELLEYVVTIKAEVLTEDDPSRLVSQHVLATAYQANGQVKEAIELLEHIVTIKAEVLTEGYPSRLISERKLAAFHKDLSERSETRQALASSIKDSVAEDKDGRQFNQALKVPQAISYNSSAFIAISEESPADQVLKSSSTAKKRHLVRRLRGILQKDK
jgi:tetratricopeptide (TPR) repeat protein